MFPGSYVPRVLCSPVVPGSLYATGELRTLFLKKGPMFPALYLAKLRNCALTKTIPKPNLSQGVRQQIEQLKRELPSFDQLKRVSVMRVCVRLT